MPRLPLLPRDPEDPLLASIFERVEALNRRVPDLYRVLGHAPRILDGWLTLAWPLRNETRTSRALLELVIMRAAQVTGAAYEWAHHRPIALKHGISADKLLALPNWPTADAFCDEEKVVLAYADQVLRGGAVDDEVYDQLAEHFSSESIIEITLTASFYANVARVLLALRVEVESSYERFLGDWRPAIAGK